MTDTPKRAVRNPDTGLFDMVDLTPEELAEQAARATAPDPIKEEMEAKAEQVTQAKKAVDDAPTAEEIGSAKTIAALSEIVSRQQVLIDALIKCIGMGQ